MMENLPGPRALDLWKLSGGRAFDQDICPGGRDLTLPQNLPGGMVTLGIDWHITARSYRSVFLSASYVINKGPLTERQKGGWSEARIPSSQQWICLQKYYGQMLYRKVISVRKVIKWLSFIAKAKFPQFDRRDTD